MEKGTTSITVKLNTLGSDTAVASPTSKGYWFTDTGIEGEDGRTLYFTQAIPKPDSGLSIRGSLIPEASRKYQLGTAGYLWDEAHVNVLFYDSGGITTSDQNKKHDITPLGEQYSSLFDTLKPSLFKYNDGKSGRTHIGLIAQEVKNSLDELEISTQDFAAYCAWDDGAGNETCGLRYEELIALNIHEIQKLKEKVTELERKLQELQG
jgi:hypothetical protein